jgi:hypothetical protein
MTIGTGIVIAMLLYLLDKHGLLKRAALVTAVLAALGLAWMVVQPPVEKWMRVRYIRHHAAMQASLIAKYHDAVASLPEGYELERKSLPVVWLDGLCKEPQWEELSVWERNDVLVAVMPKMDYFDRRHFEDQCH